MVDEEWTEHAVKLNDVLYLSCSVNIKRTASAASALVPSVRSSSVHRASNPTAGRVLHVLDKLSVMSTMSGTHLSEVDSLQRNRINTETT